MNAMPTSFSVLLKFLLDDFREGGVNGFVPGIVPVHEDLHGDITHCVRRRELYFVLHHHIQKIGLDGLIIVWCQI